jgi:hypothetical protein
MEYAADQVVSTILRAGTQYVTHEGGVRLGGRRLVVMVLSAGSQGNYDDGVGGMLAVIGNYDSITSRYW